MSTAAEALRGPFLSPREVLAIPEPLDYPFLLVVGVLASTIVLKFAGIQFLEYLYFLLIGLLLTRLFRAQLALRSDPPIMRLLLGWSIFAALALATAIYSTTRQFYIFNLSLLRQPVWVTVARLGELVANVSALIFLAHTFRRDRDKLLFTMRVYFFTGVLSAYYSLLCQFSLRVLHHLLPNSSDRANGFYNEGGPYGLYILSVLVLGLFLRPMMKHRTFFYANMVCCAMALFLARSKAADAALLLIFAIQSLLAATMRQRIIAVGTFVAVTVVVLAETNLQQGVQLYLKASNEYVILSNLDPKNANNVAGRTPGLFLIPRMIALHPWFGVGFSHYALVRDTPAYRGLSVFVDFNDDSGLGLPQYAAELGIPLVLYLVYLLCRPFVMLRRTTHLRRATAIGLVQPVAHLLGGQLNLTYPWIMSAFAIGLTSWTIRAHDELEHDTTVPIAPALPPAIPLVLPSAGDDAIAPE